jgi:CRP-like cAMP-binding protein
MKAEYSNLSILQGLSAGEQELLLSMTQEFSFNAGELIIRDSDVASDLYILIQGWVTIEMDISSDPTAIDIPGMVLVPPLDSVNKMEATVLRAGDPFGEITFLEGIRRSADVRALTSSKVIKWDGVALHGVLESNYRLGYLFMQNLARLLAQRIRHINLKWRNQL